MIINLGKNYEIEQLIDFKEHIFKAPGNLINYVIVFN